MKKEIGNKRKLTGTVVSNKMNSTVVVSVKRLVKHPFYKKYIKRDAKFLAHDKNNECKMGDKVLITESRPLSKTKRFRVSKIIYRAV